MATNAARSFAPLKRWSVPQRFQRSKQGRGRGGGGGGGGGGGPRAPPCEWEQRWRQRWGSGGKGRTTRRWWPRPRKATAGIPPTRRFRCRPPRIIIARCSITGCPRCRHLRRAFATPAEFNGGSGGGGRRTVMARMAHCANIHSGFVLLQARVRGARARKIVHVRAEILSRMMQYAKLPEEHWSGEDCTKNQYHRLN